MTAGDKMLSEITVTRTGDKIYEASGKEKPEETLPGGHDTFFFCGDSMVEQFIRNRNHKVVGIHYIYPNDHVEAQRIH